MKFLIDAQLPVKLAKMLQDLGFDAIHTVDLPHKNATKDSEINKITIAESRILISKDMDFVESILITDMPYKLLYIHTGNITNKALLKLVSIHFDHIVIALTESRLVTLSPDKMVIY